MPDLGFSEKSTATLILQQISDWHLPETVTDARYYLDGKGKKITKDTDATIRKYAFKLVKAIHDAEIKTNDFRIELEGVAFRGHRIDGLSGVIYSLRRLVDKAPTLQELGFQQNLIDVWVSAELNGGGLILLCGETGHGKSTTAASIVMERLTRYGSFCLTVENPVEMPLNGYHGNGFCIQTECPRGSFGDAVAGAMRAFPSGQNSLLLIGEIRDTETAVNALQVALNGHLVISTIHGNTVMTGLQRLISLAADTVGEKEARSMLAMTLRVAYYQELENKAIKSQSQELLLSKMAQSKVATKIRSTDVNALAQLSSDLGQFKVLLAKKARLWDGAG